LADTEIYTAVAEFQKNSNFVESSMKLSHKTLIVQRDFFAHTFSNNDKQYRISDMQRWAMAGSAKLEISNKIAAITIRNEGRLNAIDLALAKDLARITDEILRRTDIDLVLLRGDGEKAFSAGMDLKYAESTGNLRQAFDDIDRELDQAEVNFKAMPMPVIALLRGACFGGGLILASFADLRLASDDLKLCVPAIANQLYYPIPALKRLVDIIGMQRTKLLLYDGLPISPATLLAWGLIDQLYPSAQFEEKAFAFAERIAGRSGEVTAHYKAIFAYLSEGELEKAAALRIKGLNKKEIK
jgi:enoyl-CoA hydratase